MTIGGGTFANRTLGCNSASSAYPTRAGIPSIPACLVEGTAHALHTYPLYQSEPHGNRPFHRLLRGGAVEPSTLLRRTFFRYGAPARWQQEAARWRLEQRNTGNPDVLRPYRIHYAGAQRARQLKLSAVLSISPRVRRANPPCGSSVGPGSDRPSLNRSSPRLARPIARHGRSIPMPHSMCRRVPLRRRHCWTLPLKQDLRSCALPSDVTKDHTDTRTATRHTPPASRLLPRNSRPLDRSRRHHAAQRLSRQRRVAGNIHTVERTCPERHNEAFRVQPFQHGKSATTRRRIRAAASASHGPATRRAETCVHRPFSGSQPRYLTPRSWAKAV